MADENQQQSSEPPTYTQTGSTQTLEDYVRAAPSHIQQSIHDMNLQLLRNQQDLAAAHQLHGQLRNRLLQDTFERESADLRNRRTALIDTSRSQAGPLSGPTQPLQLPNPSGNDRGAADGSELAPARSDNGVLNGAAGPSGGLPGKPTGKRKVIELDQDEDAEPTPEEALLKIMNVIGQSSQGLSEAVSATLGLQQESMLAKQNKALNGRTKVVPVFTQDLPAATTTVPAQERFNLLCEPLTITTDHVTKLLKRADKWDPPDLWEWSDLHKKLKADIGKSGPHLSNDSITHIMKLHKAMLMLTGDIEQACQENDGTVNTEKLSTAVEDLRLALGAMASKVTHDLWFRAFHNKETAKKRDASKILEDLDKMDAHVPYLLNEERVKTATFLEKYLPKQDNARKGQSSTFNAGRGGGQYNNFRKQPGGGYSNKQPYRDQYPRQQQNGSATASAPGFNPAYKGKPENFIPGFVRKDGGGNGAKFKAPESQQ